MDGNGKNLIHQGMSKKSKFIKDLKFKIFLNN